MDTYVVTIEGDSEGRNSDFARQLAESLERLTAEKAFPVAREHSSASVIREADAHYLVVYGKFLRDMTADCRIRVAASDIDLASEAALGERRRRRRAQQSPSLAEEIQQIISAADNPVRPGEGQDLYTVTVEAHEQADEAVPAIAAYIRRTDPLFAASMLEEAEKRARVNRMLQQLEKRGRGLSKARVKRALWLFVIHATLFVKRLIDILASGLALLLLLPLFAGVAAVIKLTDGGPVFYVQSRIGKHGKPFPFPKFRSMVMNADTLKDSLLKDADRVGDVTFKMKRDPRVTRIGRFIRRFSIDELPQLWCVLKGDMSLVGPRPPVPREVALYTQEDRRRLEVTPGLTGIWQVSGRAEIEFRQQVELDVLYIESHGLLLDILLILKTIPAVFSGRGAY